MYPILFRVVFILLFVYDRGGIKMLNVNLFLCSFKLPMHHYTYTALLETKSAKRGSWMVKLVSRCLGCQVIPRVFLESCQNNMPYSVISTFPFVARRAAGLKCFFCQPPVYNLLLQLLIFAAVLPKAAVMGL